jgi:hypothetical protein
VGCLVFSMVVFLLLMLIQVPALYDLIQCRTGAYRSVVDDWHTRFARPNKHTVFREHNENHQSFVLLFQRDIQREGSWITWH